MKRFAVYDASGNVLRTGTCSEKVFALQARNPGEKVVEIPKGVEVRNEQHFEVKEGRLQHNPAREAAVKSAQAASKKATRDRDVERRRVLQDIADRLANLAKVLIGD